MTVGSKRLTVAWRARLLESGRVGGVGPRRSMSRPLHGEYDGRGRRGKG